MTRTRYSIETETPSGAEHDVEVIKTWQRVPIEDEIIAAFESAPRHGETIELMYRRREREVRDLFATLTVSDAGALHRRLCLPQDDDPIAMRFARLVVARRSRLLAFLADARRRDAIARSQRISHEEQP